MKKVIKIAKVTLITASIFLNLLYLLEHISEPTRKLGILKEDVYIRPILEKGTPVLKLPKGLTVSDVSPRGIAGAGQIHAYQFNIIITSPVNNLVDYNADEVKLQSFGNYYNGWTKKEFQQEYPNEDITE
jgi:hypothetical protein